MSESIVNRVLLVSAVAGGPGHASHYLNRLATGLRTQGLDVVAIAPSDHRPSGAPLEAGVRFVFVPVRAETLGSERFRRWGRLSGVARGLARVQLSRAVLRAAGSAARPGDVVHFIDYEYSTLIHALLRLRRKGISTAVTFHPADFDGSTGGLGGWYKRLLRSFLSRTVRDVDIVVCHGPWIADRLRDQLDIPPHPDGPLVLSPYYPSEGYGARAFAPPNRDATGDVRVLWFGMIRRNKRIETAAASLGLLPDRFRCHVAGHPAELSMETVNSLLEREGVSGRVETTLRYLTEEEADRAFAAADLLLATHDARFSSASGPLADARCYGIPVVVPDAGQLAEYVRATDVGIVVDRDEPAAFAAALEEAAKRLATDPSWRRAILDTAEVLSWDSFAQSHADAYRRRSNTRRAR